MSDLLIKGMKIPKGAPFNFTVNPNGDTLVWFYEDGTYWAHDMKALELPEHGDLVDRDELIRKLEEEGFISEPVGDKQTTIGEVRLPVDGFIKKLKSETVVLSNNKIHREKAD